MVDSQAISASWASLPTDTPAEEFLLAVRRGLPVSAISTPRAKLVTVPKGSANSFNSDFCQPYDFVPALDDTEIVGVYAKAKGGRVFQPLCESVLVEADSSLLEFIAQADSRPYAFLIADRQITGMATHADLQKLPVYTAVFAVASAVEMQLVAWIRTYVKGDDHAWMQHVSEEGQDQIDHFFERSVKANVALDKLSAASFGQELDGARGLGLIQAGGEWDLKLKALIGLRNDVYHAKEIALTEARVKKIACCVRGALEVAEFIADRLKALTLKSNEGNAL